MSLEEMNQLRPGNRITYPVGKSRTTGTVASVWRDFAVQIECDDGSIDRLPVTEKDAKELEKL